MLRTLNLVLLDPGGPSQFGSNYYRFGPSQSKNLSSYNWDPTVVPREYSKFRYLDIISTVYPYITGTLGTNRTLLAWN